MQSTITHLITDLSLKLEQLPEGERLLIGLTGCPGSGKSKLAQALVRGMNQRVSGKGEKEGEVAVVISMDGWHYTRAELDLFPDPVVAHARRGSADTFDAEGFVRFVRLLNPISSPHSAILDSANPNSANSVNLDSANSINPPSPTPTQPLLAPTFSHHLLDPIPLSQPIHPTHRLIIIEGLYTCLALPPWDQAARLMSERWLVTVPEEIARGRVVRRHLEAGIVRGEGEGRERWEGNDLPNGRFLLQNLLGPVREIPSLDDPGL